MSKLSPSKLLIGSLILSLGLSGCAFKKDDAKDDNKGNSGPSAKEIADEINKKDQERIKGEILTIEDFQFLIAPLERLNEYSLTIKYTQKPGVTVFIQNSSTPLPNSSSGAEMIVDGGAVLDLKISVYNSLSQLAGSFSKAIHIPRDYVVIGRVALDKNLEADFGRVFLSPNSLLKTNGYLVSITADQLIANANSTIINFDSQEEGSEPRHKTGGSITIRAKEASGFLRVILQGTKGSDGRSGNEIATLKGPKWSSSGYDGHDGESDWDSSCTEGSHQCGTYNEHCVTPVENGQDGDPGQPGYDGEDGKAGGDAGNFFVQIEDNKAFSLLFNAKPGLGGRGGEGGNGFKGGTGGAPGHQDPKKICPPAKKGADGAIGPKGKNGNDGPAGKDGSYLFNGLQNLILDK